MSLGFLKDIGGVKRLRMVMPGYDANNLSLAQNFVVFDSESANSMNVLSSGIFPATFGTFDQYVAYWSLPYVPLVRCFTLEAAPADTGHLGKDMIVYDWWTLRFTGGSAGMNIRYDNFTSRKDGLHVRLGRDDSMTKVFGWIAYRIAV